MVGTQVRLSIMTEDMGDAEHHGWDMFWNRAADFGAERMGQRAVQFPRICFQITFFQRGPSFYSF